MMCYYLNAHFQGQRVNLSCTALTTVASLFAISHLYEEKTVKKHDLDVNIVHACTYVFWSAVRYRTEHIIHVF